MKAQYIKQIKREAFLEKLARAQGPTDWAFSLFLRLPSQILSPGLVPLTSETTAFSNIYANCLSCVKFKTHGKANIFSLNKT